MVAYNSINHSKATNYTNARVEGVDTDKRDVFVAAVPRNDMVNGKINFKSLSKYSGTALSASVPHIVPITSNKFMVLWQEVKKVTDEPFKNYIDDGHLKYVLCGWSGQTARQRTNCSLFSIIGSAAGRESK
ncbi:hypothetical protein ACFSTH_16370 [Paenibacillus yanchengensis]|uniref:Uncharacterized protein n=1 Tax=Paenibacillus yanchengensis TaxID=2035833 RepID=A0ABW4YQ25_9BACL